MRRRKQKVSTEKDGLKLSERESKEIELLKERISKESPDRHSQHCSFESFDALPISKYSREALQQAKFLVPTQIQAAAIPHALAGRDILGAAKTGSGKTLAFLLPILERLYRNRWQREDGLGALVISPTRELALQTFEVLRTVGKKHHLSAGLVLGGKNFQEEVLRISQMNIIVCTPGRMLQHLENTSGLDLNNLEILVLDEADRILDLGFSDQLTSLLTYLPGPTQRQTLLFSATQTKSVKDLARLSLSNPEYIAVHDKSEQATPSNLLQNYAVCELGQKLDVLFSYIKSHLKKKTIVFLSSCAQVRFVYQVFCKMQPGVPLLALHGKVKQAKRITVYYDFLNKSEAVLFATDIAARGLDFPSVDWVVQLDCPEDVESYIHRVGRTARYNKGGRALTILLPSEERIIEELLASKVPINKIDLNPEKTITIRRKISSIVAAEKELKVLAQKAFMSYVRSTYLQPNKEVFMIKSLPLDDFAVSLGLVGAPEINFNDNTEDRGELRKKKNVNKKLQALKDKIKAEKMKKRKALDIPKTVIENPNNEDDIQDLLVAKKSQDIDSIEISEPTLTRKKKKLKNIRVGEENGKKLVFDEEGIAQKPFQVFTETIDSKNIDIETVRQQSEAFTAKVAARLKERDIEDRTRERERVREKHLKKREKMKSNKNNKDIEEQEEQEDLSESENYSSSNLDSDEEEIVEDSSYLEEKAKMLLSRNK